MNIMHAIGVLRRHPNPWRFMFAKLLVRTGCSRLFTIQQNGYQLRFYPTNVSENLWVNPHFRDGAFELFYDYCRPGDVSVDVGANVGEVSIIMSQRVADGAVFSFEPQPAIFEYLTGNLKLNRITNVTAKNLALSTEPGRVKFTDGKRDDMNFMGTGNRDVNCSTLDIECCSVSRVDFLKIDVEGAELNVLKGGPITLSKTQCVNCEMGEAQHRRFGYGMGELINFLRQSGFETFIVSNLRSLRRVDESFSESGGHELVGLRDVHSFLQRTGWHIV